MPLDGTMLDTADLALSKFARAQAAMSSGEWFIKSFTSTRPPTAPLPVSSFTSWGDTITIDFMNNVTIARPEPPFPGPATMTVPAVLRRAADAIRQRGHEQGAFGGPDGQVCTASALAIGVGSTARKPGYFSCVVAQDNPLFVAAMKALGRVGGFGTDHSPDQLMSLVCQWNNRTGNDGPSVIKALETAAMMEEARAV